MDTPQPPPPPPPPPPKQYTSFDNLRAIRVLGKGAMGTVFLVHDSLTDPSSRAPFALKVVDKSSLHTKFQAEKRARWEIQVLTQTTLNPHHFLPHLISSFDTPNFLAWAVPFCPGGDLNVLRHRQTDHVFSPAVLRFYLAEIISALEHLHDMGIAYRDLKPENVLIQSSGHVTLTDFDLSRYLSKRIPVKSFLLSPSVSPEAVSSKKKKYSGLKKAKSARVSPLGRRARRPGSFEDLPTGERSNSFVGTEEYVSPEVVRGEGHEFAVDWWALGILTYEMTYGTTPFKGRNRKETFRNVLNKPPAFVGKRSELTDLIEKLLEKDPTRRLGYLRGASEVKEHAFFKGVKWDLLTEVLRPPFIPSRDDDDDELTGVAAVSKGVDIAGYFESLRAPPASMSFPPSPSPSFECRKEVSFAEF